MNLLISLLSGLLCLVSPAWATIYYVATTGNDTTGTGAIGNPWLTINKCVQTAGNPSLAAGDTCSIGDGTYSSSSGSLVSITSTASPNGTSGSPITLKSTNLHGAKLTVRTTLNSAQRAILISKRTWWIVEGFEIVDDGGTAYAGTSASATGIYIEGSSGSNIVIRRNHIHNIARAVCTPGTSYILGNSGIFAENATFVVIEYNLLHSIGRLRNGESGCSTGMFQHDHGVYSQGSDDIAIRRNVFYDINRGVPILIKVNSGNGTINRPRSYNNTVAGKSPTAQPDGQFSHVGIVDDSDVKNNIFYSTPNNYVFWWGPGVSITPTSPGVNLQYNLSDSTRSDYTNPSSKPASGVTFSNNDYNTNPGFVDVLCTEANGGCQNTNFNLASGSAAIDTGTTLTGITCNGTCDAGAFETITHATCSVEAATPTKLSITFNNNAFPPLLPATGIAFGTNAFTARKATVNNVVTAATRVGDNQIDLTLTDTIVAGNAVDYSYSLTSGNVTDSALIGGTLTQRLNAITNQSCTNNTAGAPSYVLTQQSFKFFGLRGTEAAPVATPYASAPENTNISIVPGGKARLRVALKCTTSDCPSLGFYPFYSCALCTSAGTYTQVPDTYVAGEQIGFCGTSADQDIPTSGTATVTELLTAAGTFDATGAIVRSSNAIPTLSMTAAHKVELEYCIGVSSTVVTGNVYTFELRKQDGTQINAYTIRPTMTVTPMSAGMGF